MFDYIKDDADLLQACPECDAPLGGWQSKSGPCVLTELDYRDVYGFHTLCTHCGVYIKFKRKPPRASAERELEHTGDMDMNVQPRLMRAPSIADFEMTTRPRSPWLILPHEWEPGKQHPDEDTTS